MFCTADIIVASMGWIRSSVMMQTEPDQGLGAIACPGTGTGPSLAYLSGETFCTAKFGENWQIFRWALRSTNVCFGSKADIRAFFGD
jgi:hypothetical protein